MDDIIRSRRPKLQLQSQDKPEDNPSMEAPEFKDEEIKPEIVSEDKEPVFKTPKEMADEDITAAAAEGVKEDAGKPAGMTGKNGKMRKLNFNLHMPHGKKQWIITIAVAILVLAAAASAYWFLIRDTSKPAPAPVKTVKKVVPPKPTTEVSKLSGLIVPIGTNLIPVTAVQIENSPDARPQSGLKDASVVFEAIAEGGITRFNAIFQDTAPDFVGPIRSLRPYYIDWFWPFDASIAHVGGAPQAMADVKSLSIKDLDQFYNSGSYDRISTRYAPHNVYTSIARLNDLEKAKGYTSANFTGFLRKKESKAAVPNSKTINLAISSYFYNVQYDYDATTNTYMRSEGGAPHMDLKTNVQLAPKVVIAIVMGRGTASDGEHTDYTTVGSGHMYVFQDGAVVEGTWGKTSRQAQWEFTGADGKPIALNPGQTWLSMVDSTGSVTYAP